MSLSTLSHQALCATEAQLSVIMAGWLADPFSRPSPTAVFIQQLSPLLRCPPSCGEGADVPSSSQATLSGV